MSQSYNIHNATNFKHKNIKKVHDSVEPINIIKVDYDANISVQVNEKNEPAKTRETWIGKFDFFLSVLAYAVGLGAVWRFPYLCYKNGGGVFLIPYVIFLILVGIPLVFLELCVGQFTSTGPLTCWRMVPLFRGIGLSMNIVNGYLCIYYNMILAYSIYFLYLTLASIPHELPWSKCNPKFSSPNCFDHDNMITLKNYTFINCTSNNLKCSNGLCFEKFTFDNQTATCTSNKSSLISLGWWKPDFPSQGFWLNTVLEKTEGIEIGGKLVWQLVLALLVAWIFVYLMVLNGIKVSGKLVWFTALFPYLILLILGIKGWTLPGSDIGLKYYLYPDFSKLREYGVWIDAADQIFFTLSVTYGGLIALSSYNTFHTNVLRDAILVSFSNCLTSFFAGLVVFSYMGYLSYITGQNIDNIVQAGQGLAYVVYPFAVTTLSGSHFWAILFFVMMLVLGLDTMMASVESLITSVFDIFPNLKDKKINRVATITFICSALFLLGLIFCMQSGTYWVEIFDYYSGSYAILIVATIECISVGWIYGFKNFRRDISAMLGTKITKHWTFNFWYISWCFTSPAILMGIVLFTLFNFKQLNLNGYAYPSWSLTVGNIISLSTLSGIIIWAICAVIDAVFINKRPLKTLLQPDDGWKPIQSDHHALVKLAHNKDQHKKESFDTIEVAKF